MNENNDSGQRIYSDDSSVTVNIEERAESLQTMQEQKAPRPHVKLFSVNTQSLLIPNPRRL